MGSITVPNRTVNVTVGRNRANFRLKCRSKAYNGKDSLILFCDRVIPSPAGGFEGTKERMTSSLITWMLALTLALCAIILTAAYNAPQLHMFASGAISLLFALMAVADHNRLVASGATKSEIGASTAHHTGLIWTWGALSILVTYAFILENRWPEWWHFFLGFLVAGAACMIFSGMLSRDAESGHVDDSVISLGRLLVILQLIGMIAAIISIFIDGKFPRSIAYADWAGCNVFFFGALAIAAISANALINSPSRS